MGEKTREGVKSVVDLLERKRNGGGIKGLDDKSSVFRQNQTTNIG
jgi:hypothetical protein